MCPSDGNVGRQTMLTFTILLTFCNKLQRNDAPFSSFILKSLILTSGCSAPN